MKYRMTSTVGGRGQSPETFRSTLRGVSVDDDGNLFAVGDREVKVFGNDGRLLRRWSTSHPGISVAVATNGDVYVGESGQIEIFDRQGHLLRSWRDRKTLGLVTAMAIYKDQLFAADARGKAIRRYTLAGELELSIGRPGRRGFAVPGGYFDFSIDSEGVIHATNPGKHRVERYSRDGELLGSFGRFGMVDPADFRGCCNPTNVAVSRDGHIAVTEKAKPRAKLYDPQGKLLTLIDGAAFSPECRYMDLAVARGYQLHVADTVSLEIRTFELVTDKDKKAEEARGNG